MQDDLQALLRSYYTVQANVSEEEQVLLKNQTKQLRDCFRPGLDSLNWNSLGIPDFIKKCSQVCVRTDAFLSLQELNNFQSILNAIHINVAKIASAVESIATAVIVCKPTPAAGEDVQDLQVSMFPVRLSIHCI